MSEQAQIAEALSDEKKESVEHDKNKKDGIKKATKQKSKTKKIKKNANHTRERWKLAV